MKALMDTGVSILGNHVICGTEGGVTALCGSQELAATPAPSGATARGSTMVRTPMGESRSMSPTHSYRRGLMMDLWLPRALNSTSAKHELEPNVSMSGLSQQPDPMEGITG